MPTQPPWGRRQVVTGLAVLVALGCAEKPAKVTVPGQTIDTALTKLKRGLRKHVADKQRRDRALAKFPEFEQVLEEIDVIAYRWRTDSQQTHAETVDDERLIAIAETASADTRVQIERAAGLAASLREDLTREEWALVFPAKQAKKGSR